jgi:hypothetical protein
MKAQLIDWEEHLFPHENVKHQLWSGQMEKCDAAFNLGYLPTATTTTTTTTEMNAGMISRTWCTTKSSARAHKEKLELEALLPKTCR